MPLTSPHQKYRPKNAISSFLLLMALALVFSLLTGLADTRGIIISQDTQLNINVSIDPSLVSDAKIKRYDDKMIIELPHKAFPKGFMPGTLRVDSASRPLVKIGRNVTATTITIRSTKIFMSIQDLSALATVAKKSPKPSSKIIARKPALQSAQAKIDAIKAIAMAEKNLAQKAPKKNGSKWLEIPVRRSKNTSKKTTVTKAPPQAHLTTQKAIPPTTPKTPKAPNVDPNIPKQQASLPQTHQKKTAQKPAIPTLEEDTAIQSPTEKLELKKEEETNKQPEPSETQPPQETETQEVATELEGLEDLDDSESVNKTLEELTLMAIEEDIDLSQFQGLSLREGDNGQPLKNMMNPSQPSLLSDGTLTRVLISLFFVLVLMGLFFKYALPKLMQKYPDFFKNKQLTYEKNLADDLKAKTEIKSDDLKTKTENPLLTQEPMIKTSLEPRLLEPIKPIEPNKPTHEPPIIKEDKTQSELKTPELKKPNEAEQKKGLKKAPPLAPIKRTKKRSGSRRLLLSKTHLSKFKLWNPLPSFLGMTNKITQDFRDHQEDQRARRYKGYIKQLAQLNPELNCRATREIKPNHALHLVELWGRHMVAATTPKNISLLGALSESGEELYFEGMSPEGSKLLNELLGDHQTLTDLFQDVPFHSLPETPSTKDVALYEKYLPPPKAKTTKPPLASRPKISPETQIQRKQQQHHSPQPLAGQPLSTTSQPSVIPDPAQWNQPVFKKLAETPLMQAEPPTYSRPQEANIQQDQKSDLSTSPIPPLAPKEPAEFKLPAKDVERARQKQAEIRNEVEQFVSKALTPNTSKQGLHPYQTEEVTILKDYDDEF